MFLKNSFFKPRFFKSFYKKFRNSLELKGVKLFNIDDTIKEINSDNPSLTFDDEKYPNPNILYIHLFHNQYYNDNNYSKKKLSVEREMLFLLAGKLGVNIINYDTELIETTISRVDAEMKIKGHTNGIKYNKTIMKKTDTNGREEYLNRGAPLYIESKDIHEVEEDIKKNLGSLHSNVFNFEFYKNNQKLESFVYKRFEFKMSSLKYTLESEDISDISFSVRSCFSDFGFNIEFEKVTMISEKVNYNFLFFPDNELKIQYFTAKKMRSDPFYAVREQYNAVEDKDLAVQYIIEYVTKLTKECFYKIKNGCGNRYDYSKRLLEFIKNNPEGHFYSICHSFHSTLQIKNWIYKNLSENSFEIVNEEDDANFGKKKIERMITIKKTGEMHGYLTSPRRRIISEQISEQIPEQISEQIPEQILETIIENQNCEIKNSTSVMQESVSINSNNSNNSNNTINLNSINSNTNDTNDTNNTNSPTSTSSSLSEDEINKREILKEIQILDTSLNSLREELDLVHHDYDNKKITNKSLIITNQIELEMYNTKISSYEKKLLNEEILFNAKNKNDSKIFAKKKQLKEQMLLDDNSLIVMLRDAKLERNNIQERIRIYENELIELSNRLLEIQNEYDRKVSYKSTLEDKLN